MQNSQLHIDGSDPSPRQPLSTLSKIHQRTPYWLIAAIVLGILFAVLIITDEAYTVIFDAVKQGVVITIKVSIIAYALSLLLGLIVALGRLSSHRLISEMATFYVEIIRGVPMLVLLYFIVFAARRRWSLPSIGSDRFCWTPASYPVWDRHLRMSACGTLISPSACDHRPDGRVQRLPVGSVPGRD